MIELFFPTSTSSFPHFVSRRLNLLRVEYMIRVLQSSTIRLRPCCRCSLPIPRLLGKRSVECSQRRTLTNMSPATYVIYQFKFVPDASASLQQNARVDQPATYAYTSRLRLISSSQYYPHEALIAESTLCQGFPLTSSRVFLSSTPVASASMSRVHCTCERYKQTIPRVFMSRRIFLH